MESGRGEDATGSIVSSSVLTFIAQKSSVQRKNAVIQDTKPESGESQGNGHKGSDDRRVESRNEEMATWHRCRQQDQSRQVDAV